MYQSVLGYVAFFITVCYHTIYASPWIFPPLALYGLDILLRMFRYRIKDATLQYVDDRMTLVRRFAFVMYVIDETLRFMYTTAIAAGQLDSTSVCEFSFQVVYSSHIH